MMFKSPFSFNGRIRRMEYGISVIIYAIIATIINAITGSTGEPGAAAIGFLFTLPVLIFLWAQGAKRCHDLGNSGWWQLIPFYGLWLLFDDGKRGPNQYGQDPKAQQNTLQPIQQSPVPSNKAGNNSINYQGGHNSNGSLFHTSQPGSSQSQQHNPNKNKEFDGSNPYAKN